MKRLDNLIIALGTMLLVATLPTNLSSASYSTPKKVMTPQIQVVPILIEYKGSVVDHKLWRAMIRIESKWDPNAVSKKGAIGLMQIMPEYSKLKRGELFNPDKNIKEGIRQLKGIERYCEKSYPNWKYTPDLRRIETVLAGYNGGITRLIKNGFNLDKMPTETRGYIPKVIGEYKKIEQER